MGGGHQHPIVGVASDILRRIHKHKSPGTVDLGRGKQRCMLSVGLVEVGTNTLSSSVSNTSPCTSYCPKWFRI